MATDNLKNNLIADFQFGENANIEQSEIKDETGNFHIEITGRYNLEKDSFLKGCLVFDGNGSSISLPINNTDKFQYTYSFWLCLTDEVNNNNFLTTSIKQGGTIPYYFTPNSLNNDLEKWKTTSPFKNSLNVFHHFLFVVNGAKNSVQLYVDGLATGPLCTGKDPNIAQNSNEISIGSGFKFGKLQVFNKLITADDALALYLTQKVPKKILRSPLVSYFNFANTDNNITFPDMGGSGLVANAAGSANIIHDAENGFHGLSFGQVGGVSELDIDFSNLAPKTKNQLTFTFWTQFTFENGKFASGGKVLQITDNCYIEFGNSTKNLTLTLKAGVTSTVVNGPFLSTLIGNWCFLAIELNGAKPSRGLTINYKILGVDSKLSGQLPPAKLDADLGLGGYGLYGNTVTIGKGWKGQIAQVQIWQTILGRQQLINLLTLQPTGFLPTLPDVKAKPTFFNVGIINGIGKSFIYSSAKPNGNSITITVNNPGTGTISGNQNPVSSDNYHFAFRFQLKELSNPSAIKVQSISDNWEAKIEISANFLTIFANYKGTNPKLGAGEPVLKLNGVIGLTSSIYLEILYHQINNQSGFLLSEPIPVYDNYIDSRLIANFDFTETADGQTYQDVQNKVLNMEAASTITLQNDNQFEHIFPLTGDNSLTIDGSKSLINNSNQLSFSFWLKVDELNLKKAKDNKPLIYIQDDFNIHFNKGDAKNSPLEIVIKTPNAKDLTTTIDLKDISNEWVFCVISLNQKSSNLWYWSAAQKDNTLIKKGFKNSASNTLELTRKTIVVGENWNAQLTNFCIWQEAFDQPDIDLLLSDYYYYFPVTALKSQNSLNLSLESVTAVNNVDPTQGMKIYCSIKNAALSGPRNGQKLKETNYSVAFCFRKSDLAEICYTKTNSQITCTSTNGILIVQKDWVYLYMEVIYPSIEIKNIIPMPGVTTIPFQVNIRTSIRWVVKLGTVNSPFSIPVIQKVIQTPLIGTYNFDRTEDYQIFQEERKNGLLAYADKPAIIEPNAPFNHTFKFEGTNQLALDFNTFQITHPKTISFSFWTKSDFSKPLSFKVGDNLGISIGKKGSQLTLTNFNIPITAPPANQWVFWGIALDNTGLKANIVYQTINKTFAGGVSALQFSAPFPNLLGNVLTIGKEWVGSLAKLSVWQSNPILTQDQFHALAKAEQLDFPSLLPIIGKPVPFTIKNDPSILSSDLYLYSEEHTDKNKLSITIKKGSNTLPKITNFDAQTFNPLTDPFHFALCFRQEALQDQGRNISLNTALFNGKSTTDIQFVNQIDAGGTVHLYLIYTGTEAFSNLTVELNHIIAAAAVVYMELVYQLKGQTSFLSPPTKIKTIKNAIHDDLIADFDFRDTEDFQHYADTTDNDVVAVTKGPIDTAVDADFHTVLPLAKGNQLAIDLKGILLKNPNEFTIALWANLDNKDVLTLSDVSNNLTIGIGAGNTINLPAPTGSATNQWVYFSITKTNTYYKIGNGDIVNKTVAFPAPLSKPTLALTAGDQVEIANLQLWQTELSDKQIKQILAAKAAGFTPNLLPEAKASIQLSVNQLNNTQQSNGNPLTLTISPKPIKIAKATKFFDPSAFNSETDIYSFELRFRKGDLVDDGAGISLTKSEKNWNIQASNSPQIITRNNDNGTVSCYFIYTNTQKALSTTKPLTIQLNGAVANASVENISFLLIYKDINGKSGFSLASTKVVTLLEDPLAVYFKFDELQNQSDTIFIDAEDSQATATLSNKSTKKEGQSEPLGDYIDLGEADTISIDLSTIQLNNPNQITFDFWTKYDKSKNTAGKLLELPKTFLYLPNPVNDTVKWLDRTFGSTFTTKGTVATKITDGTTWVYWAIVLDAINKKATVYYKAYDNSSTLVPVNQLEIDDTTFHFPLHKLPVLSGNKLTIGTDWTGKITHFRIWQTALNKAQIQDISDLDIALFDPVLPGAEPSPIGFQLEDLKTQQPAIYISDPGEDHSLEVKVFNTSLNDIIIPGTKDPKTPANIFTLSFRSGTLLDPQNISLQKAYIGQSEEKALVLEADSVKTRTDKEGIVTLQFQSKKEAITLVPKGSTTGDSTITFILNKVIAKSGSEGSRGTRAEFGYTGIKRAEAGKALTNALNGVLLQYLNVIDHSGEKEIPLEVGIVGSNTILNDGSNNVRTIYIKNISKKNKKIELVNKGNKEFPATSYLKFYFNKDENYGLGASGSVIIEKPSSDDNSGIDYTDLTIEPIPNSKNSIQIYNSSSAPIYLEPDKALTFPITIITKASNGATNLNLKYQDIPGYWQGKFTIPLEKTPLRIRGNQVDAPLKLNDSIQPMTPDPNNSAVKVLNVSGRIQDKTGYVMPVGTILPFAGNSAPKGWLLCDGKPLPTDSIYKELRSVLGTTYGENIQVLVPDLRARFPIGANDNSPNAGLSNRTRGTKDGAENVPLATNEMPSHNHGIDTTKLFNKKGEGVFLTEKWQNLGVNTGYRTTLVAKKPESSPGADGFLKFKDVLNKDKDGKLKIIQKTGGAVAHNNMPPYLVINYIIKY